MPFSTILRDGGYRVGQTTKARRGDSPSSTSDGRSRKLIRRNGRDEQRRRGGEDLRGDAARPEDPPGLRAWMQLLHEEGETGEVSRILRGVD
jgi:hypothetical protein